MRFKLLTGNLIYQVDNIYHLRSTLNFRLAARRSQRGFAGKAFLQGGTESDRLVLPRRPDGVELFFEVSQLELRSSLER